HSTGVVVGGFNGQDCLRNVQLIKMNEDEVSSKSLADIPFRLKNSVAVKISDSEALLFGGWDEHRTVKGVFRSGSRFLRWLDFYRLIINQLVGALALEA
ncbi:hypothetical protein GCK32_022213, partial [Trichostrongylus colubriformis]